MKRVPTILMFALLWAMLLGSFRTSSGWRIMSALTDVIDSMTIDQRRENSRQLRLFRVNAPRSDYNYQGRDHFHRLILQLTDTFAAIQTSLDSERALLRSDQNSRRWPTLPNSGSLGEKLCRQLRRIRSFYPYTQPETFRYILKDAFPISLEAARQAITYPADSACDGLNALFSRKSAADQEAMLAGIRQALSRLEGILQLQIYITYGPSWGGNFHAITALAIPDPPLALPGLRINGCIGVMNYTKLAEPKTTSLNFGTANTSDGVVTWKGVARKLGWQHVYGRLDCETEDSTHRNLPWQFRFFCGPRFADISLKRRSSFLYAHAEIPVSIAGLDRYPAGSLQLKCSGGTIARNDSGGYMIRPANRSASVSVQLLFAHDAQTDTLEQRLFSVRPTTLPQVSIGETLNLQPDIDELLQAGGITLLNIDGDPALRFFVAGYQLRIEDGKGVELGSFPVSGASFNGNPELVAALRKLQSGDRLFVENVRAHNATGRLLKIRDAYFRLR